jgi:hypothetical protein
MQAAIPALRTLRAETGSNYPLAGKCVNHFILRVLINTATWNLWSVCSTKSFGFVIFLFQLHEKSKPAG